MNYKELYPSKYISSTDIQRPTLLTITALTTEEVGEDHETKPVIYFDEIERGWVMNKTCGDLIASWFGEETSRWAGQKIVLYPDRCQFGKRQVSCIRVRLPAPPSGSAVETAPPPARPAFSRPAPQAAPVAYAPSDEDIAAESDARYAPPPPARPAATRPAPAPRQPAPVEPVQTEANVGDPRWGRD